MSIVLILSNSWILFWDYCWLPSIMSLGRKWMSQAFGDKRGYLAWISWGSLTLPLTCETVEPQPRWGKWALLRFFSWKKFELVMVGQVLQFREGECLQGWVFLVLWFSCECLLTSWCFWVDAALELWGWCSFPIQLFW